MLLLLSWNVALTVLIALHGPSTRSNSNPDKDADGAFQPITIDARPATVQRISFDPASPPPDMPALDGREAALTRYDFECAIHVSYDLIEPPRRDAKTKLVHVVARLRRVEMKLTMDDQIFLPLNANIPLRSHEEGHHVIDARVYTDTAEGAAHLAAEDAMRMTWPGDGADEDAAGKAATDAAVKAIGDEYLAATAHRAGRIGDIYDDITAHGTRQIPVPDAIDEAFARDARYFKSSTPTTKPGQ